MLNVQQFLKNGSLDALKKQLGIHHKRHPKYTNLVHLSYDQIESPKTDPIVAECRGLILDEIDDWRVIAFPFKRFFNYGEFGADAIDWKTARVQAKMDGTLCTLFNYGGEWHVSTRGTPDAGGNVGESSTTFAELFFQVFFARGLRFDMFDPAYCYMWELTSPYNRVVVRYQESALTLIGARNLVTLNEVNINELSLDPAVKIVETYALNSANAVIDASKNLDPLQNEGFVVVDGVFNRVKIKSPQYVLIHHMRDGSVQRRLIEMIRNNDAAEFLAVFPEYQEMYNKIVDKIDTWCRDVDTYYATYKHITVRKDFAELAKKYVGMGALMALYSGKVSSAREYLFGGNSLHKVENLINTKD